MSDEPLLKELRRQFDVVDMMLTGHSLLSEKYSWRAALLDLTLLGASIVLCLTALASDSSFQAIGLNPSISRVLLGVFSGVVFFGSLVSWRVDWKQLAADHRRAGVVLTRLKSRGRRCLSAEDVNAAKAWLADVDAELPTIIPIPENQFPLLKAAHKNKVELSKLLSQYPAVPLLFLRMKMLTTQSSQLLKNKPPGTASVQPD